MEIQLLPQLIQKFVRLLEKEGKSKFTIIAYQKDLEQFSGFLVGRGIEDIREVKKEDVEAFVQYLINNNYTKKSASRKLNSIRTFFRFLKREGIIDYNPALDVNHPKYTQQPPRVLTKLEYRALRDVARSDVRTYALVELLLQTGVKIGELANIKLSDIDLKNTVLHVEQYGKTPARDIPLNNAAISAIKNYLKQRGDKKDGHLFLTRTGRPLLIRNIRQIITRCFNEVGIKDATVNDLRNTFIAYQIMNGASVEYIARVVGHKRLSSTEKFLNLVKDNIEKKEKLEEL